MTTKPATDKAKAYKFREYEATIEFVGDHYFTRGEKKEFEKFFSAGRARWDSSGAQPGKRCPYTVSFKVRILHHDIALGHAENTVKALGRNIQRWLESKGVGRDLDVLLSFNIDMNTWEHVWI